MVSALLADTDAGVQAHLQSFLGGTSQAMRSGSINFKLIETVLLPLLEKDPVDFRRVDDAEVNRAKAAIKRAATFKGAGFQYAMTRNNFLCGCLEFTEHLPEEHLIVGYGYRAGRTTDIVRVHRIAGEQRRVSIPDYIEQGIRLHHTHQTDAEVIVFHNHPRTGDEPEMLYALKTLLQDRPIASNADRMQLLRHAFSAFGLLRQLSGQGRVLFYLAESGYVTEFAVPPLLPFLDLLNGWITQLRAVAGRRTL